MKKLFALTAIMLSLLLIAAPFMVCAQEGSTAETQEEERTLEEKYNDAVLASLYEADIVSMREALDLGLLTCEELTAYYLERIESYNDEYNCFITMCDDALEIAREKDEQMAAGEASGSLFGIPVVIKDNMDYAGYHTTNGHTKTDDQIADENAEIVQYLLDEGAVIIGKTNMSTDAEDARASASAAAGETKNAYNSCLASGGSSGGSAVAVSLNFAAAGLGTDTNSSLRYPAALNGCVSLRSTWNTFSMDGITPLNDTRDVPGVLTRTVYDQALMLDVLSGGTTSYTQNLDANALQGMRIGVLDQLYQAYGSRSESEIDEEIIAAFENAVAEMEACGAEIVHMTISGLFSLSEATLDSNSSSLKENLYAAFESAVEENDVNAVVFPTYISAPLKSGTDENGVYWNPNDQTYITNCKILGPSAGVPEISVPIGTHSRGAGIGMEICALKNEEQLLLNIAYSYTTQYDHRSVPEGAENLYAESCVGTLAEVLSAYKADLAAQLSAAVRVKEEAEPEAAAETEADAVAAYVEPETTAEETAKFPVGVKTVLIIAAAVLAAGFLVFYVAVSIRVGRRRKRRRHMAGRNRK